ncbi:phosphate import ATP-binding protein PstB [Endomicrobiia bacterium]|uniref:ABC-type phosphate transporter ATPase component n=1 Tax=Endomicrobium trichonymphae TaxID=1408204 RepID=B1H046_ENDTX|nr:phosphate ABC transporter ATP-binding protein [Candidatus Endomicrobium trichonymphae]GHT03794.1 phosphate import ATP-binding protein PstB [Endomicrobiia bacterium]BAG13878.1 ABC-type phosphate transporter ATPase component [Candidatus Endomicrobium trichonymphae]BAV59044.1 ABC-type phosphate transporter ATPase component [Candidatus Endomicrobium trichonymphae]GHT11253.1 phosphate import ATP-binding protein PstB [Endomicrobiia bacterium]GHT16274.1 phosphate import ATP-binding protein PstB [E
MVDKIKVEDLSCYYNKKCVLESLNINIAQNEILSIIGPANSGKTTFLRTINRMNDLDATYSREGKVYLIGDNIFDMNMENLRKRIGMLFAMPIPLPMSIYENIIYAPKRLGLISKKSEQDAIVEQALRDASLWNEVKDRLSLSAMKMSGGQQQRLCIARILAINPEVILFDEPCTGLDPISTAKVEESMIELKQRYTIVLVTNNVKQASRVSDRTAFFLMGKLVEIGKTDRLFVSPKEKQTEDYITGRFG